MASIFCGSSNSNVLKESNADNTILLDEPAGKENGKKGVKEGASRGDKENQHPVAATGEVEKKTTDNSNGQGRDQPNEVDYDDEPTELYRLIEANLWHRTEVTCRTRPWEAATWIYRLETEAQMAERAEREKEAAARGGIGPFNPFACFGASNVADITPQRQVRWRLLPIHAAIVFACPPSTLKVLIEAHPVGVTQVDDTGSLPIHLALKKKCPREMIDCLRRAYPDGNGVKDGKGRMPHEIVQQRARSEVSIKTSNTMSSF